VCERCNLGGFDCLGYDQPDDDPGSLRVRDSLGGNQESRHSLSGPLLSEPQPDAGSDSYLLAPAPQDVSQVRHVLVLRTFSH
jgi:hypothetical protein